MKDAACAAADADAYAAADADDGKKEEYNRRLERMIFSEMESQQGKLREFGD